MSYWLKARIAEISSRDVVDMYNDTLWLAELLKGLIDDTAKREMEASDERIATESAKNTEWLQSYQ